MDWDGRAPFLKTCYLRWDLVIWECGLKGKTSQWPQGKYTSSPLGWKESPGFWNKAREGIGALGPHFGKMFGIYSVSNGKPPKGLKLNDVIIWFVFSRKIALVALWRSICHGRREDAGKSGREIFTQQQRPRFRLLSEILPNPVIPRWYEIYPNKPSFHLLISSQVFPHCDGFQPSFMVLEEMCRAKNGTFNCLLTQKNFACVPAQCEALCQRAGMKLKTGSLMLSVVGETDKWAVRVLCAQKGDL